MATNKEEAEAHALPRAKWYGPVLVVIVLASAVRQVYIAGIAASTLHTVEQMALRQSFAILTTTEIEPWQATLWQRPARQAGPSR